MPDILLDPIFAPHTLGEALTLLQRRSGLGRDEFAQLADVAQGSMSNYLRDVSVPDAGRLRRIVAVLGDRLDEDPERLWLHLGRLVGHAHV